MNERWQARPARKRHPLPTYPRRAGCRGASAQRPFSEPHCVRQHDGVSSKIQPRLTEPLRQHLFHAAVVNPAARQRPDRPAASKPCTRWFSSASICDSSGSDPRWRVRKATKAGVPAAPSGESARRRQAARRGGPAFGVRLPLPMPADSRLPQRRAGPVAAAIRPSRAQRSAGQRASLRARPRDGNIAPRSQDRRSRSAPRPSPNRQRDAPTLPYLQLCGRLRRCASRPPTAGRRSPGEPSNSRSSAARSRRDRGFGVPVAAAYDRMTIPLQVETSIDRGERRRVDFRVQKASRRRSLPPAEGARCGVKRGRLSPTAAR